jgi:tRNA pseudouridine38-40 synthase
MNFFYLWPDKQHIAMGKRYFMQISFKGTRYHGWQIQPNALTVQEVMEKTLTTLLNEDISVTGAGRTDTGVHATFYMLHFEPAGRIGDYEKLVYRMNRFLPPDITVKKIMEVSNEAHARFSAVSRTYTYYLSTVKDPFQTESSYIYTVPLDILAMNEAARVLTEYEDFTSFSKLHSDVKTNNCRVFHAEWIKNGDMLVFTIRADRFLRNMVRAIVGTLLKTGRGELTVTEFRKIIEQKDRAAAGVSAPARGLFLTGIQYPEHILKT